MKNIKTYVTGAILLTGLFLIGPLMRSPHSQANGAYSTPVTVLNTSANAVPSLDLAMVSRIPYESTSQPTGNCPNGSGVQTCSFSFPAPSTGFRLVVENVGGFLTLEPTATFAPYAALFNQDGFRNTFWSFTGTLGQPRGGAVPASFNQAARAVFDSLDTAPLVLVTADYIGGVGEFMTLSGYLESCAVTGCPTKVH